MTTTFNAALEVALIESHPNNPRHRATADQELVDSVKSNGLVQPLILAPKPPPDGYEGDAVRGYTKPGSGVYLQRYVLIAGHRRLAALKKAKIKTAPSVIREDLVTEGQQIEAMLIENGRREDLSPIEEAEGYAQLELFGYKQRDIAKAVGRDPKTVSARLRLLKLSKSSQDKLHKGQLTLEHAAAFIEFADDPATTKRLEAAAKGDAYNLKYAIESARREKKTNAALDKQAAELLEAGVKETIAVDATSWRLCQDNGWADITNTWGSPVAKLEHGDCRTFIRTSFSVQLYCTDPASHNEELSAADLEKQAEREREREESLAAQQAEAAAATVRAASVLATALAPKKNVLVRRLLPALIWTLEAGPLATYQELVKVPEAQRWEADRYGGMGRGQANREKAEQHFEVIQGYADNVLPRILAAALFAIADDQFTEDSYLAVQPLQLRYVAYLSEIGHDFCDVDQAHADRAAVVGSEDDE